MLPHVKRLRKEFQSLCKNGLITAAECCAKCQRPAAEVHQLELHHIIAIKDVAPDSDFNPNTQENIVTLCTDCHKAYHVSYEELTIDQYLKDIPLTEAYKLLAEYRRQKEERRRQARAKHQRR
jgi:5-methylcytosine-specific restriction endonuclease McrA